MSYYRDDSWIVGLILVVFFVAVGGFFIWLGTSAYEKDKAYHEAVGDEVYCIEKYSHDYSAPLYCYQYFNLQQVGTYQSGKQTKPVLVPADE